MKFLKIVLVLAVVLALPAGAAFAQDIPAPGPMKPAPEPDIAPAPAPDIPAPVAKPEQPSDQEAEKKQKKTKKVDPFSEEQKKLQAERKALIKKIITAKRETPEGEEFQMPESLDTELAALAEKFFDLEIKRREARIKKFEDEKEAYFKKMDDRMLNPPPKTIRPKGVRRARDPAKKGERKNVRRRGSRMLAGMKAPEDIKAEMKRYREQRKIVYRDMRALSKEISDALADKPQEERAAVVDSFRDKRTAMWAGIYNMELAHMNKMIELFKAHKAEFVEATKKQFLKMVKRAKKKKPPKKKKPEVEEF